MREGGLKEEEEGGKRGGKKIEICQCSIGSIKGISRRRDKEKEKERKRVCV